MAVMSFIESVGFYAVESFLYFTDALVALCEGTANTILFYGLVPVGLKDPEFLEFAPSRAKSIFLGDTPALCLTADRGDERVLKLVFTPY